MRVLMISTEDIRGGAAKAAYRLHTELRAAGQDSAMLVMNKESDDDSVYAPQSNIRKGIHTLRIALNHLPEIFYPHRSRAAFHCQWLPDRIPAEIQERRPQIVHLHWICKGFLGLRSLGKITTPIVWTLHDMWPFTGGCHYSGTCDGYKASCGSCPHLSSRSKHDLSFWTLRAKKKNWDIARMTFVAPSRWMKERATESSLFRTADVHVIPYGLDLQRFRPSHRDTLRDLFGIPRDAILVLFAAMNAIKDPRKGFDIFCLSLQNLVRSGLAGKIELAVIGSSTPISGTELPFKAHYMGTLVDEISMSMLYAAADVFVMPSLEDNLPNTIMESLACGLPCVAFDVGGIPDMIEHKKTGYLAKARDVHDLTRGVLWVLQDRNRWLSLSHEARKKAIREFESSLIAKKYNELYQKIERGSRVSSPTKKTR
jgi:glycosyltransferase involved in cell wall biosynthesis